MSKETVTLLGDYCEPRPSDIECSLTFSLKAGHIEKTKLWKSKDLSAEFFGNFWHNLIDFKDIKPKLHFICAELLENAVYHSTATDYRITVHFCFKTDELLVYVKNSNKTEQTRAFKKFIRQVIEADDIQALFINKLKASKKSGGKRSRIGLITIVKDRGATLGWQFKEGPEHTVVTTLARIPLDRAPLNRAL